MTRAVHIAREAAPQALIILGGPHVTSTAHETMQTMPQVDVVERGEGDQVLVELARALDAGADLQQVPGITFRHDDQIIEETPFPPPVDVTALPMPAFHLLPMDRYRFPALGGPYRCVALGKCNAPVYPNKVPKVAARLVVVPHPC